MNPDHPAEDEASSTDAPWPLDPQPARGDDVFVFSLFIAGMSPRSRRAVDNITKLCDRYLAGRFELQIVDIYQQPELAQEEQLVAAPTLIKKLPLPLRRFIGDLSDTDRVLVRLDIRRRP
ncbi:MAG: circadian clock KaiB family protein [Isosphaeraceae bacterium]